MENGSDFIRLIDFSDLTPQMYIGNCFQTLLSEAQAVLFNDSVMLE